MAKNLICGRAITLLFAFPSFAVSPLGAQPVSLPAIRQEVQAAQQTLKGDFASLRFSGASDMAALGHKLHGLSPSDPEAEKLLGEWALLWQSAEEFGALPSLLLSVQSPALRERVQSLGLRLGLGEGEASQLAERYVALQGRLLRNKVTWDGGSRQFLTAEGKPLEVDLAQLAGGPPAPGSTGLQAQAAEAAVGKLRADLDALTAGRSSALFRQQFEALQGAAAAGDSQAVEANFRAVVEGSKALASSRDVGRIEVAAGGFLRSGVPQVAPRDARREWSARRSIPVSPAQTQAPPAPSQEGPPVSPAQAGPALFNSHYLNAQRSVWAALLEAQGIQLGPIRLPERIAERAKQELYRLGDMELSQERAQTALGLMNDLAPLSSGVKLPPEMQGFLDAYKGLARVRDAEERLRLLKQWQERADAYLTSTRLGYKAEERRLLQAVEKAVGDKDAQAQEAANQGLVAFQETHPILQQYYQTLDEYQQFNWASARLGAVPDGTAFAPRALGLILPKGSTVTKTTQSGRTGFSIQYKDHPDRILSEFESFDGRLKVVQSRLENGSVLTVRRAFEGKGHPLRPAITVEDPKTHVVSTGHLEQEGDQERIKIDESYFRGTRHSPLYDEKGRLAGMALGAGPNNFIDLKSLVSLGYLRELEAEQLQLMLPDLNRKDLTVKPVLQIAPDGAKMLVYQFGEGEGSAQVAVFFDKATLIRQVDTQLPGGRRSTKIEAHQGYTRTGNEVHWREFEVYDTVQVERWDPKKGRPVKTDAVKVTRWIWDGRQGRYVAAESKAPEDDNLWDYMTKDLGYLMSEVQGFKQAGWVLGRVADVGKEVGYSVSSAAGEGISLIDRGNTDQIEYNVVTAWQTPLLKMLSNAPLAVMGELRERLGKDYANYRALYIARYREEMLKHVKNPAEAYALRRPDYDPGDEALGRFLIDGGAGAGFGGAGGEFARRAAESNTTLGKVGNLTGAALVYGADFMTQSLGFNALGALGGAFGKTANAARANILLRGAGVLPKASLGTRVGEAFARGGDLALRGSHTAQTVYFRGIMVQQGLELGRAASHDEKEAAYAAFSQLAALAALPGGNKKRERQASAFEFSARETGRELATTSLVGQLLRATPVVVGALKDKLSPRTAPKAEAPVWNPVEPPPGLPRWDPSLGRPRADGSRPGGWRDAHGRVTKAPGANVPPTPSAVIPSPTSKSGVPSAQVTQMGLRPIRPGEKPPVGPGEGLRTNESFEIGSEVGQGGHRIAGGVSRGRSGAREVLRVDWERDAALRQFYDKILADAGIKGRVGELGGLEKGEVVRRVMAAIRKNVHGGEEGVRAAELLERRFANQEVLIGLAAIVPGKGVCRHMGILNAAILERLVQEGYLSGEMYYIRGDAHGWAVYRNSAGKHFVLDAMQQQRVVAMNSPNAKYWNGQAYVPYAKDFPRELLRRPVRPGPEVSQVIVGADLPALGRQPPVEGLRLEPLQPEALNYRQTGPLQVDLGGKVLEVRSVQDIPPGLMKQLGLSPEVGYFILDPSSPRGFKGLRDGEMVQIGRNSSHRFELGPNVSRTHVRIARKGDQITVEDLGSRYGTEVRPAEPGMKKTLAPAGPPESQSLGERRQWYERQIAAKTPEGTPTETIQRRARELVVLERDAVRLLRDSLGLEENLALKVWRDLFKEHPTLLDGYHIPEHSIQVPKAAAEFVRNLDNVRKSPELKAATLGRTRSLQSQAASELDGLARELQKADLAPEARKSLENRTQSLQDRAEGLKVLESLLERGLKPEEGKIFILAAILHDIDPTRPEGTLARVSATREWLHSEKGQAILRTAAEGMFGRRLSEGELGGVAKKVEAYIDATDFQYSAEAKAQIWPTFQRKAREAGIDEGLGPVLRMADQFAAYSDPRNVGRLQSNPELAPFIERQVEGLSRELQQTGFAPWKPDRQQMKAGTSGFLTSREAGTPIYDPYIFRALPVFEALLPGRLENLRRAAEYFKQFQQSPKPAAPAAPAAPPSGSPARPSGRIQLFQGGEKRDIPITLDRKPGNLEATFAASDAEGGAVYVKTPYYVGVKSKVSPAEAAMAMLRERDLLLDAREGVRAAGIPNVEAAEALGVGRMDVGLAKAIFGFEAEVPVLLMKKAPGQTLLSWMESGKSLNAQDFAHLRRAIQVLHQGIGVRDAEGRVRVVRMVHGDLNAGNILIRQDPATGRQSFTLLDFGASRRFEELPSGRAGDFMTDDLQALKEIESQFREEGRVR